MQAGIGITESSKRNLLSQLQCMYRLLYSCKGREKIDFVYGTLAVSSPKHTTCSQFSGWRFLIALRCQPDPVNNLTTQDITGLFHTSLFKSPR